MPSPDLCKAALRRHTPVHPACRCPAHGRVLARRGQTGQRCTSEPAVQGMSSLSQCVTQGTPESAPPLARPAGSADCHCQEEKLKLRDATGKSLPTAKSRSYPAHLPLARLQHSPSTPKQQVVTTAVTARGEGAAWPGQLGQFASEAALARHTRTAECMCLGAHRSRPFHTWRATNKLSF